MKRPTVIFLIVLVACGMAASYMTRFIVAQRSSRMTFGDKCVLRRCVDALRRHSEMLDLPSRADAARGWAMTVADMYSTQPERWREFSRLIEAHRPADLTPAQAELIRSIVWDGLQSGASDVTARCNFTWKDVLTGSFPRRGRNPVNVSLQSCLRKTGVLRSAPRSGLYGLDAL